MQIGAYDNKDLLFQNIIKIGLCVMYEISLGFNICLENYSKSDLYFGFIKRNIYNSV